MKLIIQLCFYQITVQEQRFFFSSSSQIRKPEIWIHDVQISTMVNC